MEDDDDMAGKRTKASVDPDTMSAPDQQRVQELHAARADAEDRGDQQAVDDIDTQLNALLKAE